ncbi:unnamed protein product [Candida verbasci]|uniref:Mitochondrial thiamine pyrophosphate carrier 1 n=1 Tax=Candida verbasci TaxID=1227364 RepID=A0A9W4XIN4_9ASCO|nr:unnamed protein product [Candida verbasci]
MDIPLYVSLISGACAGIATDLAFFPIDTIKTRLQAKNGFFQNGGWSGIYKGLGSCIIASAPSASLFFIAYDQTKTKLSTLSTVSISPVFKHMIAATIGEICACTVRVPAEVIKQRTQSNHLGNSTSLSNLKYLLTNKSGEGIIKGLYRGWNSTIIREIPFTIIQFPLYEYLKTKLKVGKGVGEGAVCGMIAGGVAAAITTPLDVLKTRIMLNNERVSYVKIFNQLVNQEGYSVLLKGVLPRTCWISCGGAIFLGVYELVNNELMKYHNNKLK